MLTIRNAQMDAFEDALRARYATRLVIRAQAELPAACAGKSDGELRDLVQVSVRGAPAHGILVEADVTRYALLAVRLGRDLATDPGPVGAAVRDPHRMGSAKLDAVERAAG